MKVLYILVLRTIYLNGESSRFSLSFSRLSIPERLFPHGDSYQVVPTCLLTLCKYVFSNKQLMFTSRWLPVVTNTWKVENGWFWPCDNA